MMTIYQKIETLAKVDIDENTGELKGTTVFDTKVYTSEDLIHWDLFEGEEFNEHLNQFMSRDENKEILNDLYQSE